MSRDGEIVYNGDAQRCSEVFNVTCSIGGSRPRFDCTGLISTGITNLIYSYYHDERSLK